MKTEEWNNIPEHKEINFPYIVYIIENEQPWWNWYGELLSYYPGSNFAEVRNDENEIKQVRLSEIFDADNIELNIKEILL